MKMKSKKIFQLTILNNIAMNGSINLCHRCKKLICNTHKSHAKNLFIEIAFATAPTVQIQQTKFTNKNKTINESFNIHQIYI